MEKDIGQIPKNEQTNILLRIDDFGGNRGLTIREFVTSERYTGFTKAGVRIKAADFPKFKEMINSISEHEMKEQDNEEHNKTPQKKLVKKEVKKQEVDDEIPDY